jgi:hypothetical protein
MKDNQVYEAYFTQGEYVTYYDKDFISMGLDAAAEVRTKAIAIATKDKTKVKEKSGSGINRSRKTVTLPKRIWKEAYLTVKQKA